MLNRLASVLGDLALPTVECSLGVEMETFIETDCTIEHNGRKFTAAGAFVSDQYVVAYVGKDWTLTDWHGNKLGNCHVSSSWRINSFRSDRMYQIYATINGVQYTGRGLGEGMVCRFRRCARQ